MNTADDENIKFAERLNSIFDDLGYDDRGRAQRIVRETKLDISDRAVNKWLKGEGQPTLNNLKIIAKYYGVNFNWLATGAKDKNFVPPTLTELRAMLQAVESEGEKDQDDSQIPDGTQRVAFENHMNGELPVISWVAAGSFSEVIPVTSNDEVIKWIPRPRHLSQRAFGLIIEGRSMLPEFKPGEIIYVDPEITVWDLKDGDLIVIHCNDEKQATFKQLVFGDTPEDMYLKPLNPDWPEQRMVPMSECQLVGVVDSKYTDYRRRLNKEIR